jgi:16S rRNA G966 N2-methylase RsmD
LDYAEILEQKYGEIISNTVKEKPRVTIGQLINIVFNILKNTDRSKTEIRDAILLLAGYGKLSIEAISKKRLEVTLKKEEEK